MLRRDLTNLAWLRATVAAAALALAAADAAAAPRITEVMNAAPPHAKQGEKVLFGVEGLVAPVRVFFSDGTSPTVEATPVRFQVNRGFVAAQVPEGAKTGYMKITANGVDSPLHYFRIDEGVYDFGSGVVQGTVQGPGGPIQGTMLALLRPDGCDEMDFVDLVASDAAGAYTLHGPAGDYLIFAFPPVSSGLIPGAMPVALGESPVTVDIELSVGITVTGRIVRASSPSTGVANARVDFESESGYETRLTDASGYFSVVLPPGGVTMLAIPSPSDTLARKEQSVMIGTTSPQSLLDVALDGGVRIFGFVRRAADGLPLPGVWVSVREQYTCCDDLDEKTAGGDGGFSLFVPAGRTYEVHASVDDDAPYADLNVSPVVVETEDFHQDIDLQDAGAITGRVVDSQTGEPVVELNVQAFEVPYTGATLANARTCSDGSYRLRVTPNESGYVVGAAFYETSGFVPVVWNGTESGTFYPCEGTAIPVPDASTLVTDIDIDVHSGPASVSGSVVTQASGCTQPIGGSHWVFVDDGTNHGCGLGFTDWSLPPGTYRVVGLPGADLVPGLRVCHPGTPEGGWQCWNVQRPPAYTPVTVQSGQEATGIDFCLGAVPTKEVSGLLGSKDGGSVTFAWTPTDDPYQMQYMVRGAMTAAPIGGQGAYPTDPPFDTIWTGTEPNATFGTDLPHQYFLVTNVGMYGVEGPSGSYVP